MSNPEAVPPALGEKVQDVIDTMLARFNLRRAEHYQTVFQGEDGELTRSAEKIVADLDRFCRGNASTFDTDPRVHALLEGRREVYLRILGFLEMDTREARQFVEVKDE